MPVTSVNAPDGSIIKVNHPEGAPREVILEYALQEYKARGKVRDVAPDEIPTVGGKELEPKPKQEEPEQIPQAPESFYPDGYSVGDALLYLRNAGIPEPAIAAVETLLTLGTGAVGGTAGFLTGAVSEIGAQANQGQFGTAEAAQAIQEAAMRGAERNTYFPRTGMAQRMLGQLAEVTEPLEQLPPVFPTAGLPGAAAATLPQRARMAQAAIPERRAAAPEVPGGEPMPVEPPYGRRRQVEQPAQAAAQVEQPATVVNAGALRQDSVGAARVTPEALARARAEQMPVPFAGESALTKGQASGSFEQLKFEIREAKQGVTGKPLRERQMNQRQTFADNIDAAIDEMRPMEEEARDVGLTLRSSLLTELESRRAKVRKLYKEAEEAGELEKKVDTQLLADTLNELWDEEDLSPIVSTARKAATRESRQVLSGEPGELVGGEATIKQLEQVRKKINKGYAALDATGKMNAKLIKGAIDEITKGVAGEKYKAARAERANIAQDFDRKSLVRMILDKKRDSDEYQMAEDTLVDRIERGTRQELAGLRSVLNKMKQEGDSVPGSEKPKAGEFAQRRGLMMKDSEGRDAWRNVKARIFRNIYDKSLSRSKDEAGQPFLKLDAFQKRVEALSRKGTLEFLYGKRMAQFIKDLGDVLGDLQGVDPRAVNWSNTTSEAFEQITDSVAAMNLAGIPPAARAILRNIVSRSRDAKLKARIRDALKEPNE